jgi:translation initiation factor IF-3
MKEIRMQPKIERHDLVTKSKFIADFLNEGNKVKVSIRFRGRELAHTELGKVVLDKILNELTEMGVAYNMDRRPLMEGKMMSMIISPQRKNKRS